jgi:hypothetical protein
MRTALVYDFPPFDTGLFDTAEFLMSRGDARLLIKVTEHSKIILQFKRVRWHEFTALNNCSAEQVESASSINFFLNLEGRARSFHNPR